MKSNMGLFFLIYFYATPGITNADTFVTSINGNSLLFSQKKTGENIDNSAWGKLFFVSGNKKIELSRQERFYVEDGYSKKSPSGNYIVVSSISGGMLTLEDGTDKYIDRAYCSVIDMRDGCIVSDWDGEACAYEWVGNKDVLASSEEKGSDVFDFIAMRPLINKENAQGLPSDEDGVRNSLRCDPPNKNNIGAYQTLLKTNNKHFDIISKVVLDYFFGLPEYEIKNKSALFFEPKESSKSKAYLIPGDRVRIIQETPDGKWINIGYVNKNRRPLITWIETINLK